MYIKELEVCGNLAIEAGIKIMEIYETDFVVEEKADKSPLTQADKEANQIIVDGLKEAFPDYAILSEESKDDRTRLNNDYCFIVDPIDGTKEFVNKNGEFTVNIGLSYKHHVVMGIIYVPVTKELYLAASGEGAMYRVLDEDYETKMQKPLKVTDKISNLILVGSKSHASDQLKALIEEKKALIKETKSAGSSLKGCLVAKGNADVYYRFGYTCEWDTAAMQCIVEEAGGIFKQMDNSPMTYNRENSLNDKGFYVVNNEKNIWV
jgi:3'(2'), 5'-bisphosphate nucleotidase